MATLATAISTLVITIATHVMSIVTLTITKIGIPTLALAI